MDKVTLVDTLLPRDTKQNPSSYTVVVVVYEGGVIPVFRTC